MSETAQAVKRIAEKNKFIAGKISDFFVSVLAAHKLQSEIQRLEESAKTVELRIGGINLFMRLGKNRSEAAGGMREQLKHYYSLAAYEHESIVQDLDCNLKKLDFARSKLESDTPELIALTVAINKLGAFTWAFKDLRADMVDLFAIPDVQQIFWAAMAKKEMGIEAV
jgi:hypothetical protein